MEKFSVSEMIERQLMKAEQDRLALQDEQEKQAAIERAHQSDKEAAVQALSIVADNVRLIAQDVAIALKAQGVTPSTRVSMGAKKSEPRTRQPEISTVPRTGLLGMLGFYRYDEVSESERRLAEESRISPDTRKVWTLTHHEERVQTGTRSVGGYNGIEPATEPIIESVVWGLYLSEDGEMLEHKNGYVKPASDTAIADNIPVIINTRDIESQQIIRTWQFRFTNLVAEQLQAQNVSE